MNHTLNNKGITLVEFLIVTLVLGIIASFGLVVIGSIVENTKISSFLNTGTAMIDSARNAYNTNDSIWNDNVVTLRELKDNEYIIISSTDPWGNPYDMENSYVTIDTILKAPVENDFYLSTQLAYQTDRVFKVKLVSATATIGYEVELSEFDETDIVFEDSSRNIIDTIEHLFSSSLKSDYTASGDADSVEVSGDLSKSATLDTQDGNDTIVIGEDVQNNATVNTGDGDDMITVRDNVEDTATINSGSGNDEINIDSVLKNSATINAGAGDDTINITTIKHTPFITTGDGNDTVTVTNVQGTFKGTIDLGNGDDILNISDSRTTIGLKRVSGATFNGGSGNDTLILSSVTLKMWNSGIKNMFSGFETIQLKDTTIYS
jgi:prepilin-type N-terminal cleavage/methylation domain-containing protein